MTSPRTTTIAATCGKCETQIQASQKPSACFACGAIDGPWALVRMQTCVKGGSIGIEMRVRLVGPWSDAARAQASAELGDTLLEEEEA